jgi:hypothetical protein
MRPTVAGDASDSAFAAAVCLGLLTLKGIQSMATNKPTGDNARKGAVRKRIQLRTKAMGENTWTKRNKKTGQFMEQKKSPAKKKFKGVRRENKAG